MAFKPATKKQTYARVALYGTSGGGKTVTSLMLAYVFADQAFSQIAYIDTEHGSASKYIGDTFHGVTVQQFMVDDFDGDFSPARYIRALSDAAAANFPVVIIDSLSHAWAGKGGILEQADAKGGRFDAWKHLTPQQHKLVEAILAFPGHVIATMRSKSDIVIDQVEKNGRTVSVPRKIGLAPVQRDQIEYEFDIFASMDADNTMRVEKSRCPKLEPGQCINRPGPEVGQTILSWLRDGVPALVPPPPFGEPAKIASVFESLACDIGRIKGREFGERVEAGKRDGSLTEAQVNELRKLYGAALASAKSANGAKVA